NDTQTNPKSVQHSEPVGVKINTGTVSNLTGNSTENDTGTVPNMGLLIKHKHINKQESNVRSQKIFEKNKALREKVNELGGVPKMVQDMQRPSLPEVEIFFQQNEYPVIEA